jgi:hypothetical protein
LRQVGNGFVRYRDQKRSFSRRGLFRVVDREVKAGILREWMWKLPQQEESVGRKRQAKEAENEICS